MLVIATIFAPIGVTAFWAQQTLTNTDNYVRTVTDVFTAKSVRESLGKAVAETVSESDVVDQGISKLLPDNLSVLSPLLATALGNLAGNLTERALSSAATEAIARLLAEKSHEALMAVLTGKVDESSPFLKDGDLVLDISALGTQVVANVSEKSPALGKVINDTIERLPEIVLLEQNQISALRSVYAIASPVLALLLPFTLALYVIAVVLSHNRDKTLMQAGAVFVGSQGLLALGLWWVKDQYINQLTGGVFEPVVKAVFDQLLTFLWQSIGISVLIGAIAFFVGLGYTLKRNSTISWSRIT